MRTMETGVKRSAKIVLTAVLTESRRSTNLSMSERCCGDWQIIEGDIRCSDRLTNSRPFWGPVGVWR